MGYVKPVDYTVADHRHQHRGYMTAVFESQPKPVQWLGPGRAKILLSHWHVKPLEVWMKWMSGKVSPPYPIEDRWWLKVQPQEYIYLACKTMKPYAIIHGQLIDEVLKKINVNRDPKAWKVHDEWIQEGLGVEPELHYEGISDEYMNYHRLGYAAALLDRTRTWYRWEDGHITIQIRHINPEPLHMVAKIANHAGGPDPAGARWILTMNNQKKIHRFLELMWPYAKIPECKNVILDMIEGKKPQNLLDIPIKECYTLTEAGKRAVGIITEAPNA